MNAALAVGAGLAVVGRNRRAAANLAAGPALDLALSLSGVQLRVTGRENLWKDRPAVFVFNHQSNLDPLVVGALVRRDFTATGKKEAKWDPSAILVGRLVDTAYLDRERPAAAKEELNRLVARIARGESVIIAPEGTRSATAKLLPFKHGALHLALEAGVPIVPVVLRNTARLMAPGASTIRSGVADICVLDPVPTDGWKARDIALHAENVRTRIQETLERWPGDDDD
jgi:putative phosphoserine phosphatase/1-acylglycerol-3-phosphate O-acyltransferase